MTPPDGRRVSCTATPSGCLLWLCVVGLAVWLVAAAAHMWGAR